MIKRPSAATLASASLLALLTAAPAARAQPDLDDPPARVARLALAQGEVSFSPAGYNEWFPAQRNRPVTTGDQLWSDGGGRVALELDSAELLLGDDSAFSFLNLSDHVTQMQLTSGVMVIDLRALDNDMRYEVDTPNLAFTLLRPGVYRISIAPDGARTVISIARGYGEATGGGFAYTVRAGETDAFTGVEELFEDVAPLAPATSPFDRWAAQTQARFDAALDDPYLAPGQIGGGDLVAYGAWTTTPDYGPVWFPRGVDADWAPYQRGHWAYIAPWGYTWIDDQPWGFTPFHYGRWVHVGGAWGWTPGPRPQPHESWARPVYAPALVAWIGLGPNVGWVPLAPREVYVPAYHASRDYATRVNVTNTTINAAIVNTYYNTVVVNKSVNITNLRYANSTAPGAVATLPAKGLAGGLAVSSSNAWRGGALPSGAAVQFTAPAAPPARGALGGGQAARTPPAAVQLRPVVARITPPSRSMRTEVEDAARRPAPLVRIAPPATPLTTPPMTPSMAPAALATAPAPPPLSTPSPGRAPPRRGLETLGPPASQLHAAPTPTPPTAPPPSPEALPPPAPTRAPPRRTGPMDTSIPRPAAPPTVHAAEVPPPPAPAPLAAASALQREHFQQQEDLSQLQARQREQLMQQQMAEHQRADAARAAAEIEAQHRRQTLELQAQHAQALQALVARQQAEKAQIEAATNPARRRDNPKD